MKFYLLLYSLILLISSTSIADEAVFITCKCKHFYWKENQELKGTSCDEWASTELDRMNYEINFNEDGKYQDFRDEKEPEKLPTVSLKEFLEIDPNLVFSKKYFCGNIIRWILQIQNIGKNPRKSMY